MIKRLRKIKANANWYVWIKDVDVRNDINPLRYGRYQGCVLDNYEPSQGYINAVEKLIIKHIDELCKSLNVSEEQLLTPQYIDKIVRGLLVEKFKDEISGFEGDLDESTWDTFLESHGKIFNTLCREWKNPDRNYPKEYPKFKANFEIQIKNTLDNPTTENIKALEELKTDDNYYNFVDIITRAINKAVALKCEREVDNYSLEDIKKFEEDYCYYLSEHIQELLNIRRDELFKNDYQEENITIEPNNRLSEKAKIANQKIFAVFGVGSEGEMYFVKGFPDADTRARIKAEGGRFNGALKRWYFDHKATGFGSLYLAYAQDLFYPFKKGYVGKNSLKINMSKPRSEEVSELLDKTRFDDDKQDKINKKIENNNFSIGDTITVKAECIRKYNYRGSAYVFNFVDDDDNHFVVFSRSRFKFCNDVKLGDIITLGGTIKSSQVNYYTQEFEYVLEKPTAK